jgi:hypothetical protein
MTVVSIVFAVLLMTLTLASTQFSPRILISFVRDRTTQWTLGVFLGTFSYCMAALPAARGLPHPFVPVTTVTGAMLLAPVCVGWLIYFINHISRSISVNHIVDRIARETELVIDEFMPYPRSPVSVARSERDFSDRRLGSRSQSAVRLYPLGRYRSPYCPCEGLPHLCAFGAPRWSVRASRCSTGPRIEARARANRLRTPYHRCLRYWSDAYHAAGC